MPANGWAETMGMLREGPWCISPVIVMDYPPFTNAVSCLSLSQNMGGHLALGRLPGKDFAIS